MSDFDLLGALSPPARRALNCYDGGGEQGAEVFFLDLLFHGVTSFACLPPRALHLVFEEVAPAPKSVIFLGQCSNLCAATVNIQRSTQAQPSLFAVLLFLLSRHFARCGCLRWRLSGLSVFVAQGGVGSMIRLQLAHISVGVHLHVGSAQGQRVSAGVRVADKLWRGLGSSCWSCCLVAQHRTPAGME